LLKEKRGLRKKKNEGGQETARPRQLEREREKKRPVEWNM